MARKSPAPTPREQAQAELNQIDEWLRDFRDRQEQAVGIRERAAYLNGWIARDGEEPATLEE